MIKKIIQNKKGMSALITIIVITAVALIVATTAALTSIDQTQSGLDQSKSLEVEVAAESCLEHALAQQRLQENYAGEILQIDDIECVIEMNGVEIEIQANDQNKYYSNLKENV